MLIEFASTKAVILVGGEGTRLRPLTYTLPKPMLPVLNRPFLEHTIAYLRQYDIDRILLAASYRPEVIQNYFGDGSNLGIHLAYAIETNPLGTAGAVKNVEQHLASTFFVFNGDIFTDLNLADMLASHQDKKAKVTIALTRVDNPSAYGVVETGDDTRVKRFVEKPAPGETTSHWINAGVYILEREVLQHILANSHYMFEKGLFPCLIEMGKPVYGYPFNGYWLDMGTPQKYRQLNFDLLLLKTRNALINLKRDEIRQGDGVILHPSAVITAPVIIGDRSGIERGARIKGPVVIGQGCLIETEASLEAAIVLDGSVVKKGANLKQCIVSGNDIISD